MPRPWTRWQRSRRRTDDGEVVAGWSLEALGQVDSAAALGFAAAVVAASALVCFVLLPLLGIAVEIGLLLVPLGAAVFSRVVLRRPWTIEAADAEDPTHRHAFAVVGWRRSRRALAALAAAVETTGPPAALPEADPLAVERPLQRL